MAVEPRIEQEMETFLPLSNISTPSLAAWRTGGSDDEREGRPGGERERRRKRGGGGRDRERERANYSWNVRVLQSEASQLRETFNSAATTLQKVLHKQ